MEIYMATKENLHEVLEMHGVAIIPSVLDETECENIVSGMWDTLEHITQTWSVPLNRMNEGTWREFYKLFPMHSMLLQHWIGHAKVSWDVRQNEKIVDIFAHFWKCTAEELLVSFDGFSFNLPPEVTRRGSFRKSWLHSDQSYTNPDFACVQSWVTGLDVEEGDASLTFLRGSHKHHTECIDRFNIKSKKNWHKITDEQNAFYVDEKGCVPDTITCPKGSVVFWDSRTVHCGKESVKGRKFPKLRAVIYLCYMPRKIATRAKLLKKQKAFLEGRTTSHWPCDPILFGKNPRTYGAELPEITAVPAPELGALGKLLAGF